VDGDHHRDGLAHPEVNPEPPGGEPGQRDGAEVDQGRRRQGAGEELRRGVVHPEGAADDVGAHHSQADEGQAERHEHDPHPRPGQGDEQCGRAGQHLEHHHGPGVAEPRRGPLGHARPDQPADAAGRHHDADAARVEVQVAHEVEDEQGGIPGEGEVRHTALQREEAQEAVVGDHPDASGDLRAQRFAPLGR